MLTQQEQALAADASVMFTKNKIIQAVYELFGKLADAYKLPAAALPAEVTHLHPKISKGENYLGLPWVMLDYPRHFAGKEAFAVRTMFWWGHYFSLHLLLQGSKMQLLKFQKLAGTEGWYFSTASDPWQHQYNAQTAVPAKEVTAASIEKQAVLGFYKLSIYLPLQKWDNAEVFLTKKFEEILELIKTDLTALAGNLIN